MPDAITYTAMMNAAARAKGATHADYYLQEMLALNLRPTIVTYGTLFRAWFKEKKYTEALAVFEQMRRAGFCGNVLHYTQAFISLSRLKRVHEIESVLENMCSQCVDTDEQCRQVLEDALGTEEYARVYKKFRLDKHSGKSFDKIGVKIEQTEEAKLDNMSRYQTKAVLRRSS